MSPVALIFAVCAGVCGYVYFGYPALIYALSRLSPRPVARGPVRPSVSLIVPAHDEEAAIEAKIRNSLALRYPPERLELVVVSDGSTDATDAIVSRHAGERVRLIRIERAGKAAALDAGARAARGEILAFSDANAELEPDSLTALIEPFADPEVGGVCGNKRQRLPSGSGADTTAGGEGLYWRYDKWQKSLESRYGSIFAADGTLYALRRELYVPIADPAQADDIAISTRIVLQGRRLLYEPAAVAWEDAPVEGSEEFRRKVRVTNHSVRALLGLGSALWLSGFYSVELVSHKLLRHLVPFFLIPAFLSSALLAPGRPAYLWIAVAQLLFYGLGAAGLALRRHRAGRSKLLTVPYYFCLVNAAAFLGVLSILAGRRLHAWRPRGGLGDAREE